MNLFYLIGVPGAGKSTLMRAIFEGLSQQQMRGKVPHIVYKAGAAAQIGRERDGGFGGTDALAMNAQPAVLAWLASEPYPVIVAEGDRLGNSSFFKLALQAGVAGLTVAHLAVPESVAAERRQARGSKQDPTWLKGRVTKVAGVAGTWANLHLDGTRALDTLVDQCRESPTLKPLFT